MFLILLAYHRYLFQFILLILHFVLQTFAEGNQLVNISLCFDDLVFQSHIFPMYFLSLFLSLVKICLDRELGIEKHLSLILHSFLLFFRLYYLGFELLDLLSEHALFRDLLVTELHLKAGHATFVGHVILDD